MSETEREKAISEELPNSRVTPPPTGITRGAVWVLFGWTVPAYFLLMLLVHSICAGEIATVFNAMNVELPLPTNLTMFLMRNSIMAIFTILGLPVIWVGLNRFLTSDRYRLSICGLFCAVFVILPTGMLMSVIMPIFAMQAALREH